jgi:hypothetical protein
VTHPECARPTGWSHGRTTEAFTLLISIRFSLEIPKGPGHPEGYPGPVVIQLVACVASPNTLLYSHGSAGTGEGRAPVRCPRHS